MEQILVFSLLIDIDFVTNVLKT